MPDESTSPANALTQHRPGERTKWAVTTLRGLNPDGSELWQGRGALDGYRQVYNTSPAQFLATWMQDPSSMRGEIFKEEWLRFWVPGDITDDRGVSLPWTDAHGVTSDELIRDGRAHKKMPIPAAIVASGMGVDLAVSKKQSADYTSFALGSLSAQGDLFLNHVVRERLTLVEALKAIKPLTVDFKIRAIGVEEDLLELVMEQIQALVGTGLLPWVPVELEGDKVLRARPLQAASQLGRFYLRYGAPWLSWYIPELLAFPGGVHDDVVDASSCLFEVLKGWKPGDMTAYKKLLEEIRTPNRLPEGV